jgi:RND family efflux transporter MFP subunit
VSKTVLSLLTLALALGGCRGEIAPGTTPGESPVIHGLTLETVAASPLPEAQAFLGTVESPERAVLAARIDGRVAHVAVTEGATVQAGQLLLTIAGNPAAERLAEAEGVRRAAGARLELAEKTHARYRQLFEKEAVTAQEMDRVDAELEAARQQLAAAQAGTGAARVAWSATRIAAPFAGRVAHKEVEAGSTVLPGTPLLVLDRLGASRVRADLPESFSGRIAAGDPVSVEIPALGRTFAGRVAEVSPAADPGSRSFQIKIDLPSGEAAEPGLFARVTPAGSERPAILVPARALVERGQLTGVFVAQQGILRFRLVRTGRSAGERVEILSGLAPGERVVVEGAQRAKSGARVEK